MQLISPRLRKSARDFRQYVKPFLEAHLDGSITQIENRSELDQIIRQFDVSGIDAFLLNKKGLMQGIASRVVYGDDYHSFTVRYAYFDKKTKQEKYNCEFSKKLEAQRNPEQFNFFPYYTVQSNCASEGLRYAYLVQTTQLISFIAANKDNPKLITKHFNKKGGARFYSVEAGTLKKCGIEVTNILEQKREFEPV